MKQRPLVRPGDAHALRTRAIRARSRLTALAAPLMLIPHAAMSAACAATPSAIETRTTGAALGPDDPTAVVARLERERNEAMRLAGTANAALDAYRGRCMLTDHELQSLRERDAFEEAVWWRLDHADTNERALRDRMTGATRERRAAIEASVRDAAALRDSIQRMVRKVHSATDLEWPRLQHDLESSLTALEQALRPPE